MLNRIPTFITLVSLIFLLGACNSIVGKKSIVVKDCTGSYLQIEGSDFRICNKGKVENIPNGTAVIATFRSSTTCEADNDIVCEMYHKYEDDIRISKIKLQ